MKKFLIEIEEEEWEKVLEIMEEKYATTDPDRIPPLNPQVMEDYIYGCWAGMVEGDIVNFNIREVG